MENKKETAVRGAVMVRNGDMTTFNLSLAKRSDRLATALYLVTGFLSDNEPIKNRLRMLSLDLVRMASVTRHSSVGVSDKTHLEGIQSNIAETLALLELAFVAGLVSEMNFTILKREYGKVRDSVEVKKLSRESHTDAVLGGNFFGGGESDAQLSFSGVTTVSKKYVPNVSSDVLASPQNEHSIGHDKGHVNKVISEKKVHMITPARMVGKGHGETNKTSNSVQMQNIAKQSRRARIVKLVKDNREVSIKDIIAHFADVSEKTIQRELVSLAEEGVLKRTGERRWSRYSLAS